MKKEKNDSTLSAIPPGERDSKVDLKPARTSHRKPTPATVESLELPKNALIAFRKSGGLKFSSRQSIVFPDGRVLLSGTDLPKSAARSRKLSQSQIADLRQTLTETSFLRLKMGGGKQPPDSYAYEIVAEIDSKTNYIQVFDGKIPESLLPLIQRLTKLLF